MGKKIFIYVLLLIFLSSFAVAINTTNLEFYTSYDIDEDDEVGVLTGTLSGSASISNANVKLGANALQCTTTATDRLQFANTVYDDRPLSINAWVYMDTCPSAQELFGKIGAVGFGWYDDCGGLLQIENKDAVQNNYYNHGSSFGTGSWKMITQVVVGNYNTLYLNGVFQGQGFNAGMGTSASSEVMNICYSRTYSGFDGYFDEFSIWSEDINASGILAELYNGGVGTNPIAPTNLTTPPNFISPSPANDSVNNTQVIFNVNCSDGNVYLWFNKTLVINNLTSPSNYSTNVSISQIVNVTAGCYNGSLTGFSSNVTRTWTYDITLPTIQTDFVNGSIWFDYLYAQFNFSDNFYLNSFNISIDGVEVASNGSLSGTFYSYNLSTDISALTPGLHNLTVTVADGHTAKSISNYSVSNGLFNDYLKFSWDDKNGDVKSVKITNSDKNILDSFSTKKEIDRYVWDFEPYDKTESYVLNIETDDPIRIIEDNNTYLKTWIVFGNKWMDFDLFGENSTVKITKVNDKFVKVNISNIKNPDIQKFQSIGDLNIVSVNYSFYKLNASVSYQSAVFEGSVTSLTLRLILTDILTLNISTSLVWDNVSLNVSRTNISNGIVDFSSTFIVPFVNASSLNWTFFFNVSDGVFNITNTSDFIQMNITNCSTNNYVVLNYTIYDEELQTVPIGVNATIENFLTITTPGYDSSFNFTIKQESTNLLVCLPNNTLNYSSWILDATTKYYYTDHVEEFHIIENFDLNLSVIPIVISLYDLLINDSTSFFVSYQDENYLYIEGVVIDLLRQFTHLNGQFFSVEHAKTDQSGQTVLHFVEEDVVYIANVWDNGVLVYTSGEFQALCQSSPCKINLRQPYSGDSFGSILSNIVYDISSQSEFYASKQIIFLFSTNDGTSTEILMNVTQSTSSFNVTICSISVVLSAGSITCTVPPAYYNSSYTVRIYKDKNFLGWSIYSLNPSADDVFGRTGVFLSAIGYLMLAFMGISSASASIVLGLVGLMAMMGMNLLDGGSLFGIGSTFIWIIIASAILIWKYQQRRVQ